MFPIRDRKSSKILIDESKTTFSKFLMLSKSQGRGAVSQSRLAISRIPEDPHPLIASCDIHLKNGRLWKRMNISAFLCLLYVKWKKTIMRVTGRDVIIAKLL